jgi:hypothetical protein
VGGVKDRLKRLEQAADNTLAVCRECGEERRLASDPHFEAIALQWQMAQPGAYEDKLLAKAPPDLLWIWNHPCDPLALRDRHTGESVFGAFWEKSVRARREREASEA